MRVPLESGCEWEVDPAGNEHAHGGRTICQDLRDKADPKRRVMAKRPQPEFRTEIYSIAMERVAYSLAVMLDLPVPATHLEILDGHLVSVQRPRNECAVLAPAIRTDAEQRDNEAVYAAAALFDVWLANIDRRDVNLLFEPEPPNATPGRAVGSRCWLIDHGLWPANRTDAGLAHDVVPDDPGEISGEIRPEAERQIATLMPAPYRLALKNLHGPPREQLLDAIRSVGDDDLRHAVEEVPDGYMSKAERDATVAFLKGRRSRLSTVLIEYW